MKKRKNLSTILALIFIILSFSYLTYFIATLPNKNPLERISTSEVKFSPQKDVFNKDDYCWKQYLQDTEWCEQTYPGTTPPDSDSKFCCSMAADILFENCVTGKSIESIINRQINDFRKLRNSAGISCDFIEY